MRFLVIYFRHRDITARSEKIKTAVLLTFLISSYLYINYSTKVFSNVFLNGQFRNQITLPLEATNIQFNYDYDGFLPDYSFTVKYDLPGEMTVDRITYQKGNFSKSQSFEIVNNKKRVSYSEFRK